MEDLTAFVDTATFSNTNEATLKAVVARLVKLGKNYGSDITHLVAYKTADWTDEGVFQESKKDRALRSLLKSLGVDLSYCLSATADPFEDVRDLDTKLACE